MTRKVTKTKTATAKGNRKVSKQEVAPIENTLPAEAIAGMDAYLEGTAAEDADFIKFIKGEWVRGVDEEAIEEGTEMAVNIGGIFAGHVKWQDKRPVDERMTPIIQGMFTPRSELGDLDRDQWDVDDNGVPQDPWTRTSKVHLKDIATGAEGIYSTSSKGGICAVGKLIRAIRAGQRQGLTGVPTVALGVDSYPHDEWGKVYTPVLALKGFKSEQELLTGEPDFDADLDDEIPNML